MILHVDMDAFFASVEQLDNPQLRGRCVVVGKSPGRGVVAAASYEARSFGVRSAMALSKALSLCPDAVVVAPRMERYRLVSGRVMEILSMFSPLVEQVSIDEAYLDVSGCRHLHGSPETIAGKIKKRVAGDIGITCSVGVAPLKFLAKIASGMNKPDGLTVILPEDVQAFIENLPIEKVPGVGKVTQKQLALLGVETLGDLARVPEELVVKKLGRQGMRLRLMAMGQDRSEVSPGGLPKSVSSETTLPRDTADIGLLKRYMLGHSEDISRQLHKAGARARVVSLKVKYSNFKEISRQVTLENSVQSANAIYREAVKLLRKAPLKHSVRLIGLGVSRLVFVAPGIQLDLFAQEADRDSRWEKIERFVAKIEEKYGKNVIKKGTLSE
ncbi:MAG: DNA polymerase IV [Deltaproteobacteria bacterium]|nr:MAG: DNA polymerase IV [Deltaproteobacteria bacterium]